MACDVIDLDTDITSLSPCPSLLQGVSQGGVLLPPSAAPDCVNTSRITLAYITRTVCSLWVCVIMTTLLNLKAGTSGFWFETDSRRIVHQDDGGLWRSCGACALFAVQFYLHSAQSNGHSHKAASPKYLISVRNVLIYKHIYSNDFCISKLLNDF